MDTLEKLDCFLALSIGWHYGEGVSSQPIASEQARALLETATTRGFVQTDVFPGINGEVAVTLYNDIDYWSFTFDGGLCDYRLEKGRETISEMDEMTLEEALDLIPDIVGKAVPFRNV